MSTTLETTATPPAEKANGLATYFNVIFSPAEAFALLGRVPMWGWAAIGGILLTMIGQAILWQATMHMSLAQQAQQLSQMPADQAAAAREAMTKIPHWIYPVSAIAIGGLIGPWVVWLVGALVYLIAAALSGGEARFKLAWVTAVNLYIIGAVGSIIAGVIVALRGGENVNSAIDLFALPSLAMFVHGSPKLAGFLYSFNIVNIWLYVVAVIALQHTMKMGRGAAIATVVVLALIGAGIAAAFSK
jgi:hypothetical protein